MIFTSLRVPASGPKSAKLAAIGMSPQKWELADGIPFMGPSGKIFNEALATSKVSRASVFVTNMCNFYIDDNDLYSVPSEIMDAERFRVFNELEQVKPNCLFIMGGDTLWFLTGKDGIQKWRGSIFELTLPSGRKQKCIAAMHPASFLRGQWKWMPLFKYIDVPRAVTQSSFADLRLTPRAAIVGPSFRQAREYIIESNQKEWVSIDYEGTSHITCLGLGWTATEAMCVPLSRVGSPSYWTLEEEMELWRLWCVLLQNPKVKKIAQNAAYEWIKSWLYGVYPNPLGLDTMLAHHCLYPDWGGAFDEWTKRKRNPDNPGHGLALITSQYTDQPFYKDEGRHWRPEAGEIAFWRYNCLDVMVTFESAMKMIEELRHNGLWDTYIRSYNEILEPSLRMEWYGIQIDLTRKEEARVELMKEIEEARSALQDSIKMRVITKAEKKGQKPQIDVLNLASPVQMKAFFTKRGYKIPLKRETGRPTLDKDALARLAIRHSDPDIGFMLTMKKTQDLINDVIDQELDESGRIHCHFKLGGTNGTRWSSTESILGSGTNLQNLPRQGVARSLFLPS